MDLESLISKIVDSHSIGVCIGFDAQHWGCWGVLKKAEHTSRFGASPD